MAEQAAPRKKIRIGDLMVHNGVITEEQLMHALSVQKKTGAKLGNTLIELNLVTSQQFNLISLTSI